MQNRIILTRSLTFFSILFHCQVYVCQLELDLQYSLKHNIHERSEEDISNMIKNWEPTPKEQTQIDVTSMLQRASISEVEMEDAFEELSDKEDILDDEIVDNKGDQEKDEDEDDEVRLNC